MRGSLRTLIPATAAFTAAVALYVSVTLPRATLRLDGQVPDTVVAGAYHMHSRRSDGTGTMDQIAEAAARAGLRFVIVTDHGDGTRTPDPPRYHAGVLCIDAVELNTSGGHLVALGLREGAPYPLAGAPRDVIEDVHRLGGFAIAAHPDSPKPELRWRAQGAPVDGMEWINADSEWRDEGPLRLLATGLRSLVRPPGAIASLFGRPVRSIQRWDAAARTRAVVGLAAVDAHARIGWREDEEPRRRTALARPTYETMFRTLTQTVVLDAPLTGEAAADADAVLGALTAGRTFSTVRALAWPSRLTFTATPEGEPPLRMGQRWTVTGAPVRFDATTPSAPGARLTLYADGRVVAGGQGRVVFTASTPGVYRVEAALPDTTVPWLMSNPIVLTSVDEAADGVGPTPLGEPARWVPIPVAGQPWAIEQDPSSTATITVAAADQVRFDFLLGPGAPSGQYAAMAASLDTSVGVDRIAFTARADRPVRLSVQIRLAGRGSRWRHSVYVDETPRPVTLWVRDFAPADAGTSRRPIAVPIQSVLFVVDTVNTEPGRPGRVWVSEPRAGVVPPP